MQFSPVNEQNRTIETLRLAALSRYDILDTPREEAFDRIVRLIRNIFDVPVALVSMMAADRQWYKACVGLDVPSVPRENTICQVVIETGEPLIVPDLSKDARFRKNPFVEGPAHLRFYAGIPLRSPEGFILGTLCAIDTQPRSLTSQQTEILHDLSAIVMHELELRKTAEIDALTKVLSRRAFSGQAKQVLGLMARQAKPTSLIMLDIDRFKAINDTFGHASGDHVLAVVAQLIRQQIRSTDLLGRLGGEEFAILLPGSSLNDAKRVAEKIRRAIEANPFQISGRALNVTASSGVATGSQHNADLEALLGSADAGLYEAKARGRNRVIAL